LNQKHRTFKIMLMMALLDVTSSFIKPIRHKTGFAWFLSGANRASRPVANRPALRNSVHQQHATLPELSRRLEHNEGTILESDESS